MDAEVEVMKMEWRRSQSVIDGKNGGKQLYSS